MHKEEIRKLIGKTQQKGLTLIPVRMYFKNGKVKVELALAKGKQLWINAKPNARAPPTKKPEKPSVAAARRNPQAHHGVTETQRNSMLGLCSCGTDTPVRSLWRCL